MVQFGLTSVTFRKKSAEKIIGLAREAGLSCIEWGGDIHVPPENLALAREIGIKTRDAGLAVCSYGSYYRLLQPVEEFRRVSAAAAALQTDVIRIWAGEKASFAVDEDGFSSLAANLRQVCAIAAEQGQTVALEFHKNTYADTAATCLALLKEAGSPNAKTYWQPIYDRETELKQLEVLSDFLTNIHVFHWDLNGKRFPLKKGEDWASYAKVIRELPGAHPVLLEFVKHDSPRQFRSDAKALKDWFQK